MIKKLISVFLLLIFVFGQAVAFTPNNFESAYEEPENVQLTEDIALDAFAIDNASIDKIFSSSEVTDKKVELTAALKIVSDINEVKADKEPTVAFILSTFLGWLGIHRAYMGTSTGTIIGYILTLGGCGIIAGIDWIFLLIGLINDDIDQYVDNTKFFMW